MGGVRHQSTTHICNPSTFNAVQHINAIKTCFQISKWNQFSALIPSKNNRLPTKGQVGQESGFQGQCYKQTICFRLQCSVYHMLVSNHPSERKCRGKPGCTPPAHLTIHLPLGMSLWRVPFTICNIYCVISFSQHWWLWKSGRGFPGHSVDLGA